MNVSKFQPSSKFYFLVLFLLRFSNLVAVSMMPVLGLLGYTSYSFKSKMEEFKDDVADNITLWSTSCWTMCWTPAGGWAWPSSYVVLDCPATAQGGQNNDHSEEVGPLEGGKVQTCLWCTVVVFSTRSMASTGSYWRCGTTVPAELGGGGWQNSRD